MNRSDDAGEANVNPVVRAILSRRSVRDGYADTPVPTPIIEDVVRCGLAAPSSKNARPWRLHVVRDRRTLRAIAEAVEFSPASDSYVPFDPESGRPWPNWRSTVAESAAVLRAVPCAVFIENRGVFSRGRRVLLSARPDALASSIVGYTFEVLGVGAAIQNMWLAAVSHGVSAVFMGDVVIAEDAIRQRLGIACDLIGVLALGFAEAAPPSPPPTRRPFDPESVSWIP